MEDEVCSDSEDGDMDDLMEDGECDQEGGEADQPFPKMDEDMTVDRKKSGARSQTEERGTQLSNDEAKLAEESQNEVLVSNLNSAASNREDCNERAGDSETRDWSNNTNGPNVSSGLNNNANGLFYSQLNIDINQIRSWNALAISREGDEVGGDDDDREAESIGIKKKRKTTEDGGFTTLTCADGRRTRGIVKRRSFHVAKAVARMRKKVAEINGNLNGVGSINSDEYKVTHVESSGGGRERCQVRLQETKIDEQWIEDVWGSRNFGYVQVEAKGRSRGLLLMTTSSANNSVFRGFFEKQKLTGPNFIDWYRQLRIVLSIEDKLNYLEQPLPPAPVAPAGQHVAPEILAAHTAWVKGSKEIAGLMLMTMEPEIQRNLENLHANDMLKELKALFAQQAEQELLQTTRDFHACKQEEGQSVSSYVLKMKGYIDNLERLGHPVTLGLAIAFIDFIEPKCLNGSAQAKLFEGRISIMGEPLSPDRVFDFPMDEPHPAYGFFAPGSLLGYAGNPNNNNGWIEADDPLLGELGAEVDELMVALVIDEAAEPIAEMEEQVIALVIDMEEDLAMQFGDDDDFDDDDFEGFEGDEEVWEVNEDWLMAPVIPPSVPCMPPPSTYEVGGPSTAAAEGHTLAFPAPGFPVPPLMIEDLSTRIGNLEYEHGQLVKKVIKVSDAEVADNITIREIGPSVSAIEGQVHDMASQMVQAMGRLEQQRDSQIQQLQPMVSEMSSRESTLMQCILGMDRRLADLEKRPPGPQ
ncbi:hypothetical protein Tco_1353367 [Tanacetum coccineum]